MKVITKIVQLRSSKENDIIDFTEQTSEALKESKLENGIVTAFVSGSTAAITTIEYEPGLRRDFPKMLSRIVPKDIQYHHDDTWHDGNGHSHVRASLIGPSLSIPFSNGRLISRHMATNSNAGIGYKTEGTGYNIANIRRIKSRFPGCRQRPMVPCTPNK